MSNPAFQPDTSTLKPIGQQTSSSGGVTFQPDSSTLKPIGQSGQQTPSTNGASMGSIGSAGSAGDYFHTNPNDPWYKQVGNTIGGAVEGVGEGVMSGVSGVAHIQDKVDRALGGHGIPTQALATMDNAAGNGATHGKAQNVGYGGETLMEFMLGDEALKGVSLADKALNAGKTLKTVEKSPRLMEALKIGAKELAKRSAAAGAVQGAQTFVRTSGDVGQAAEAGLETAGVTGALGGVADAVGGAASRIGGAAKTAGELADTAASAPDTQTTKQNIQGQLENSKTQLHANYESKIQDFENRLQGSQVDPKTVPISRKAEEILQRPNPEDHSSVADLKEIRGEGLTPKVRGFLERTATGTRKLTDADIEAAETANKSKPIILGADGRPIESPDAEPIPQDQEPHDAHSLIQWRQQARALAAEQEPGSVDAKALNRLLWDNSDHSSAFDDTFSQLARQSNDPNVVREYSDLRNDYRSKIGIYDTPVIKNLMEGKGNDAAKAFIGTNNASGLPNSGKSNFNVQQLHTILGDDGFNDFRRDVFDNMLQNASDDKTGFNPAKFISTWKRVDSGTRADFFGYGDPKVLPQSYVTSLVQDAKTAANLQKLTRAGLVLGAGAGAGTLSPVAGAGISTILGFIAAGGGGEGGIGKGREIIDYFANNPKAWAAFRGIGKLSNLNEALESTNPSGRLGKIAKGTAKGALAAARVAPQAAVNINQSSNQLDEKAKPSYQAAQDALSGTPANPNQGSSPTKTSSPAYITPSYSQNSDELVQPGNIDLNSRKDIKNPDGSHSSVFSMSFGTDAGEVLVPGVGDGKTYPLRKLTPKEALDQYKKTGKNLGIFKTPEAADRYGETLHEDQAKMKVVNGKLTPQ